MSDIRVLIELRRLREGLRQVAEGDYPADAGNAETWALEVLANPAAVNWYEDAPSRAATGRGRAAPSEGSTR